MLSGLGEGTHIYFVNTSALVGGVEKTPPPTIRWPLARQEYFKSGLRPEPRKPQRLDRQPAVQGTTARSVPDRKLFFKVADFFLDATGSIV